MREEYTRHHIGARPGPHVMLSITDNDLNNLLTVINGYSELAVSTLNLEDPLRHQIEEIEKAGTRAVVLTQQLLSFSRKQVREPRILAINSIVSDLEGVLKQLMGGRYRMPADVGNEAVG